MTAIDLTPLTPLTDMIAQTEATKKYIERHYENLQIRMTEYNDRRKKLQNSLSRREIPPKDKQKILSEFQLLEMQNLRLQRYTLKESDFSKIKVIGRGAFGEIILVRCKLDNQVYVMKKLSKLEMHRKAQLTHVRTERDIMADTSSSCSLLVKIYFSFQDEDFLYLIMEYLAGGDMMNLLIMKDILPESWTQFYIAQMLLALDFLHVHNYLHRDVKPDNCLFTANGDLKMSDFGLAAAGEEFEEYTASEPNLNTDRASTIQTFKSRRRLLAKSKVGTADYVAPEVLVRTTQGYGPEADWWSVGCIMFECLCGYPPFCSDSPQETCNRVIHHKQSFSFPPDCKISAAAKDLIQQLLKDAPERIGTKGGVRQILAHPFFEGLNIDKLKNGQLSPPFHPDLSHEIDTKYFEHFEEVEQAKTPRSPSQKPWEKIDAAFLGYTFKRGVEYNCMME